MPALQILTTIICYFSSLLCMSDSTSTRLLDHLDRLNGQSTLGGTISAVGLFSVNFFCLFTSDRKSLRVRLVRVLVKVDPCIVTFVARSIKKQGIRRALAVSPRSQGRKVVTSADLQCILCGVGKLYVVYLSCAASIRYSTASRR